jgi:SM-20-related protein
VDAATPMVNVTLLLAGGHSPSLRLAKDDPLLRSLLASLEDKADGGARVPKPYHLRVEEGRRSLVFSGRDLVGIVTDPPLAFDRPAAALPDNQRPSRYRLVENFLDARQHDELLRFAVSEEARFAASAVTSTDTDYRRSKVLHDFPLVSKYFRERIGALAPRLMQEFEIPLFTVADIECQMTAHNEGNYFKLHNDNGSPDTATRTISYVYYFHGEPKAFTGGEFRLYHSRVENGAYHCGEHAVDIEPRNNSILFFPSHCHHEVMPVRCPSERFADSRFTVNGWIRRAA